MMVEPRGFEPLTSCLQIGPINRGNGFNLGGDTAGILGGQEDKRPSD